MRLFRQPPHAVLRGRGQPGHDGMRSPVRHRRRHLLRTGRPAPVQHHHSTKQPLPRPARPAATADRRGADAGTDDVGTRQHAIGGVLREQPQVPPKSRHAQQRARSTHHAAHFATDPVDNRTTCGQLRPHRRRIGASVGPLWYRARPRRRFRPSRWYPPAAWASQRPHDEAWDAHTPRAGGGPRSRSEPPRRRGRPSARLMQRGTPTHRGLRRKRHGMPPRPRREQRGARAGPHPAGKRGTPTHRREPRGTPTYRRERRERKAGGSGMVAGRQERHGGRAAGAAWRQERHGGRSGMVAGRQVERRRRGSASAEDDCAGGAVMQAAAVDVVDQGRDRQAEEHGAHHDGAEPRP